MRTNLERIVQLSRLAAIAALLAGCGSKPAAPTTPPPSAETAPAAASSTAPGAPSAAPAHKAEIGAWGFDLGGMDRSVAPGADFYHYANGHWLATTPIPADKPLYAMFIALSDRSRDRTREILEASSGAPGSDGQRVGDYYKAFMDEAAIEAKGTAPIQPTLDAIARLKDKAGVIAEFAAAARRLGGSPFFTFIAQDDRAPETHIANLLQGGLGLPDRDMYDAKNQQFAAVRDAYKKYIATTFALLGWKDVERRAAAVYALEDKIAKTHWTRVQNRDPQKTYNKMTPAELAKLAPGVDWRAWLKAVGLDGQSHINVNQPSAIAGESQLVKSEPLAVWKDYLALRLVSDAASYLPKKFVDAQFELEKSVSGSEQIEDRWKRAVSDTTNVLGEAIGKIYVTRYFTPETKARADALVKNLLTAMGQRLDGLAWMSAETKAKAKTKLATYHTKIGYPDKWRDYSALTVVAGDAVGNAVRAAQFEYNRLLAKLGKPVDRDEWAIPPMTVDAYYSPTRNEIVFPAGILQPPFFDPNADDAVNYGGIGSVIGHEISHGFDDQGAQYDATGALKNWWTKDDADKFKTATAKLVAQYSGYCPIAAAGGKPAQCVKGELTLGENIADLAGLTIAYTAYKLSLGGKPPPVLDGFTGDQRFFLGFAQVWRGMYREQMAQTLLVVDPHSPVAFRATTVRNLDAWYDAFKPRPGDALYLAPDQRVRIW
jgi:putative endopeptidase